MLADTRPGLVGTVMLQLKNTNPGLYDEAIIYYTDEIDEKDRRLMTSIMPCRFVKYAPPLPEELFERPRFKLFSILMFCRYEMFHYLDEFETVTWLDTDILIQGSLQEMIASAEKTGAAFIREDPINKTAENPDCMRTCFTEPLPGYKNDDYLYCSGTIVVSRKFAQYTGCTQWCYEKTVEWADILSLPDQGVLNAAIQHFHINVTAISGKKYCCYPYMGRDCSDATIIHTWGLNKFWNDWYSYLHFPAWGQYYKQWCDMGGSSLPFDIQPRISVVIPSYKPNLQLLKQCLDSMRNQNRANWERFSDYEVIIVAEPVEVDPLREMIEELHDARIRLEVNETRLGIAASLNRGLRLAKGKYIARMDDDDLCAPSRFYLQAEYLDHHPEIMLCTTDFEYFGDMNERRISFEGEMSRAWSIFTCPFDHPTIMFRKDFFVDNDLYYDEERGYVEDWELWCRAFDKGLTVGCIHEVLFYHRWMNTGSAGQTNRSIEMMREMIQNNFRKLGVEIPTNDLSLIGPWNGKLLNDRDVEKVKAYFEQALESNKQAQIYDQHALEQVFALRIAEAETGVLPGLSEKVQKKPVEAKRGTTAEETANPIPEAVVAARKPSLVRFFLKRLLRPLYEPIRRRYEDRLVAIQHDGWKIEGHAMNCIHKLDQVISAQQEMIQQLSMQQEAMQKQLSAHQEYVQQLLKQRIASNQLLLNGLAEQQAEALTQLTAILEHQETSQAQMASLMDQQELFHQQLQEATPVLVKMQDQICTVLKQQEEAVHQQDELHRRVVTNGDHLYDLHMDYRFHNCIAQLEDPEKKRIFLIGTPEHSNIGDAAIALGEREFIAQYFADYRVAELSAYDFDRWYEKIAAYIRKDDLIFLHGGGNLGNRYLNEERIRRRVIQDFPNNRVVILPQTIHFDATKDGIAELEKSQKIYNSHTNLLILTRGKESLHMAKEWFPQADSLCTLDMALLLKPELKLDRKGILLCMRDLNDESGLSIAEQEYVQQTVCAFDADYLKTNNLNNGDPSCNILCEDRWSVVHKELMKYSSHKVIVTDRLHGLIFSVITKTPCVLISSYDHKIAEFYDQIADSNAVFFVDRNLHQLESSIRRALAVEDAEYPSVSDACFARISDKILNNT